MVDTSAPQKFWQSDQKRQIIKDLIYGLVHKVKILECYYIMNSSYAIDIYQTMLNFKKQCGAYTKAFLYTFGCTESVKK